MKLKLPHHEVEAIHSQYQRPRDRLFHVIITFLRQEESKSAWKVIIDALKSPAINLPLLASRLEEAHLPNPSPASDNMPETPGM